MRVFYPETLRMPTSPTYWQVFSGTAIVPAKQIRLPSCFQTTFEAKIFPYPEVLLILGAATAYEKEKEKQKQWLEVQT